MLICSLYHHYHQNYPHMLDIIGIYDEVDIASTF